MLDPVARPLMMPTCSVSIGRLTFLQSAHITDRITRFLCSLRHINFDAVQRSGLSCHALSGKNMSYGVHRAACFLETQCHALPRHVMLYQTTARSLFARRRQSPDDVMWRRAATWQMRVASATCAALKLNRRTRFWKLANTQVNACLQAARKTQKPQRTLHNNLTTPTVHTSMCSDIFGNNRHMP